MPPPFMPGLSLCRLFYLEAVRPLLDRAYPGRSHAAARIAPGPEVLGFDSERSVDHDWGSRLEVFLSTEDVTKHGADISALLTARLPKQIHGWPTNFEPPDARVRVMTATTEPVAHRMHITDVSSWSTDQLSFDPRRGVTTLDWLAETTGDAVFHDDIGDLTQVRSRLQWYPDDVWRYMLAAQWTGRSFQTKTTLGS